ncbi:MAG TPA: hypothetical protein VF163_08440 [Micromonosporaceae bacterium]
MTRRFPPLARPARLAAALTAVLIAAGAAALPTAAAAAPVSAGSMSPAPGYAAHRSSAVAYPFPICRILGSGPTLADTGAQLYWSLETFYPTTTRNYWSVVATRGSQGYDSDLALYDRYGCEIGASLQGGFSPTDWVAFDTNSGRLPTGTYPTRVLNHPGNTSPVKYYVQFVDGGSTLSTYVPSTDQAIGSRYASWMVDIRDVYLTAGTRYTFTVTGGLSAVYLLSSSTTDSGTWARTPATTAASLTLPGTDLYTPQTGSFSVTAAQTGWYGALFVRNGWWGAPVSVRIAMS